MKEKSIYHGLLIYFLEEKNKIIKERTGISLVENLDMEEVRNWELYKVLKFFNNMTTIGWHSDIELCPWCANHYNDSTDCRDCGYGFRHGHCIVSGKINPGSNYGRIIEAFGGYDSSLYNVTHIQVVAMYVRNLYKDISSGVMPYSEIFRQVLKFDV
jgi:hypothetical protein